MGDLISIIIPAFNCADCLGGAIESALAQDYPDIEVVVVDDGSTDSTPDFLFRYEGHARVRCFRQRNMGPGAARNTGLCHSRGRYACFLDADDLLEAGSLTCRQQALAAHNGTALVFSDYLLAGAGGETHRQLHGSGFLEHFRTSIASCSERAVIFDSSFIELFHSFSPHPIWTGTVMIRRDLVDSVGLFRTDISVGEDIDYWLRIADRHRIAYVDRCTALYNTHRSTLTKDTVRYCRDRIECLKSAPAGSSAGRVAVNSSISETYFQLGYHYFNHGERFTSLACYLNGLCFDIGNAKCMKGLMVSTMPPALVGLARRMRSGIAAGTGRVAAQ